jgi:hypothetical protein
MKYPHHLWAIRRPGIIPVFFLSVVFNSYGQLPLPEARSIAYGYIESVGTASKEALRNPAWLGYAENPSFSAGHSLPFLVKEIGISSLTGILPLNPGAFQIEISSYGLKDYRNYSTSLEYGMPLSNKFSAGISFHYYTKTSQSEWNYLWTVGLGAGCLYKISERTELALTVQNPFTTGNYKKYGPLFPGSISLGLAHEIYVDTWLQIELYVQSSGFLQLKTALEYRILETLILRCAYNSSPYTLFAGSGIILGKVQIEIAFAWTGNLGICPAILLTYKPK